MISDYSEINIDKSIFKNIYDIFDNDKSEPFNPYQSLLFILPKESFNLLPQCYQQIPQLLKEYFPDKIDIDYNGKIAEYESLLLLPVLDEEKMLETEKNCRKLTQEEEKENKWGTSYLFNKNDSQNNNINFIGYDIYQKKDNIKNTNSKEYGIAKCDFSFPTLKTIDYDYQLINVKQYFGRTYTMTKQISLYTKLTEKINMNKIYWFLKYKTIFIDYPFKAFGELIGFIYNYTYNYLSGDYLISDNKFILTNKQVESIRYYYEKRGIILEHPEILCDVCKLQKVENNNGEITRKFEDKYINYVPFEITSLNTTTNQFQNFIKRLNKKIGGNYQVYNTYY
jgi:5'-3' exonuclease